MKRKKKRKEKEVSTQIVHENWKKRRENRTH